jgi:hypothetical protein
MKIQDKLLASGRTGPHRAGSSGYVSYRIRGPEDVAGAIELFCMNYDRVRESAQRHAAHSQVEDEER